MRLVADGVAGEDDVVRGGADGDGVVAVVHDAVGDADVGPLDVEAVGVEGKPAGGFGVDDGVGHGDVVAVELDVPRDGLARAEVLELRCARRVAHQVWPVGKTAAVGRVCVPPGLAVRVDPAVVDVVGSRPVDAGALEREPRGLAGFDDVLDGGDVLGKMQIPEHSNLDIAEIGRFDRVEDVVVNALLENDG